MAKTKKTPALKKLPFVVAPRLEPILDLVGTEDSGQIEITRQGYLSVGEKAFMTNVETSDISVPMALTLTRKVAQKYEIDSNQAYQEVFAAATGRDSAKYDVREHFNDEVDELLQALIAAEARKIMMKAYCLLMYRIDSEIEMNDVIELHPDIVTGLAELFDDEESKSIERLTSDASAVRTADSVEDLAKK